MKEKERKGKEERGRKEEVGRVCACIARQGTCKSAARRDRSLRVVVGVRTKTEKGLSLTLRVYIRYLLEDTADVCGDQ